LFLSSKGLLSDLEDKGITNRSSQYSHKSELHTPGNILIKSELVVLILYSFNRSFIFSLSYYLFIKSNNCCLFICCNIPSKLLKFKSSISNILISPYNSGVLSKCTTHK